MSYSYESLRPTVFTDDGQRMFLTAMQQALAAANSAIVGGIEGAVKIKLAEVAAALKVTVKI